LDALDEHDGDNSQLANFIYRLLCSTDEKVVKIKICVASRTWNIFGEHFGTCPQFAIHEQTAGDIQAYTSGRLLGPSMSLGEEARLALAPKIEQLSLQVTTKARGVFIWVRIVVDELAKGIRDGTALSLLEEKVSKMPEELEDLYRHTLERIEPDYVEEAYIMLQVALCSLAPLPIDSFMKCVSFTRWKKIHETSKEEIIRQLTSRSGGLLEIIETVVERSPKTPPEHLNTIDDAHSIVDLSSIDSNGHDVPYGSDRDDDSLSIVRKEVQFIHQTVKDFIAENRTNLGLHLRNSTFKGESGYLYLLECATNFGGRSWAHDLSRSMWEYAFLAEADGVSDMSRFRDIFTPMLNVEYQAQAESPSLKSWIIREIPHYAQSFGRLSPYDQFMALAAAADLKMLIAHELDTDPLIARSATILTMAATGQRLSSTSASRESMVKLLLKFRLDINFRGLALDTEDLNLSISSLKSYCTPLTWVLRQESQKYISMEEAISLARLLLKNGANPNADAVPDPSCPVRTSCCTVAFYTTM
jgi:hypothetical protein